MPSKALVLVSTYAPNGAATMLYTSPASGKGTWIDAASATNLGAAVQTLDVYRVPSGGSATGAAQIIKGRSLAASATDLLSEMRGKFLNPGDMIWASANAATSIALDISGRELT